jgi:hypothetical protein
VAKFKGGRVPLGLVGVAASVRAGQGAFDLTGRADTLHSMLGYGMIEMIGV